MVRNDLLPCNTWQSEENCPCITRENSDSLPSITWYEQEIERLKAQIQNLQANNSAPQKRAALTFVQDVVDFEAIRVSVALGASPQRILFELKLGRQASGYKTAQKALNKLIAELKLLAQSL